MRKKSTTKDASSKRDNYYHKKKEQLHNLFIYQHLVSYAAQHRFKVGGVEGRRRLRGRLSDYNGKECIW